MSGKIDIKVLELITEIKKQKNEIKNLERPKWKTNLEYDGKNIQIFNTEQLLNLYSSIFNGFNSYKEALKDLNLSLTTYPYNVCGFGFFDWKNDILILIDRAKIKQKRDKLIKLEERLESIISPELKAEIELNNIVEELKNED